MREEDITTKLGTLNQKVEQLYQQGQYHVAVALARQGLQLAQTHLGPEHPDTAGSLNNLGCLLQAMGDLAGARPYYEEALAIDKKVLGPDHPDTATSLNNLGFLLQAMGDLAGARPCYEEALAIRQKVLGLEHPDTATSLNNLGSLLQAMGDLVGARPCYEEALAIRQKVLGPEHSQTATSLNNLGALLQAMGDLTGARPYLEGALAIRKKVLGTEHPDTAASLNNLGFLLRAMGDLAGARPYYEGALAISKKVLGPEHPQTATSLHNLGGLLKAMGDLAGARPYYEEALAIRQKILGPEHPDTARSLNSLGALLQAMGDLAGARPYLEGALAICQKVLGPEHPHTATSLHNLGVLCVALDQDAEALTWMQQAAAIDDRRLGQIFSIASERQRSAFLQTVEHKRHAFLSLVSQHLEDSPKAVQAALDLVLRRKAVTAEVLASQRDAVLGGKYPALQAPLRQWASLRLQIAQKTLAGPGPEGLQAHQQQLAQWTAQKESLETQLARQIPEMNLARKLQQADRRAVALALDAGVSLIEFVRFHVFDFKAVRGRGEQQWQPAQYLAFVLAAGEPNRVQMIDLGEADPIDCLIADFRSGITGAAEYPGDRNMVKRHPEAASTSREGIGRALRAAVFDKLAPALGGHQCLLLAPDSDLTRLPFEVLPGADGRLLIDTYQISYVGCGRDVLRFGAPSTGQTADALVVADPDFDLGTATAGSQQATRTEEAVGRRSRDFDRSQYHFGRLPGTRVEGERVAALLKVQPWLDVAALEARLKQHCRSPRILHLATHGFFLQDQPHDPNLERRDFGMIGGELGGLGRLSGPLPENPLLRSGLALAGANTWLSHGSPPPEAEDGLLTAEDVSGLDLLDTELVVLSACETGLGEVHTGEGVFGLQRAFVLAGAKTLVMSLWSVPDEATRELMEDFYRRILSGQPRAAALREAQMTLRAKYPDPFYWGAFICQGNPGPLPQLTT